MMGPPWLLTCRRYLDSIRRFEALGYRRVKGTLAGALGLPPKSDEPHIAGGQGLLRRISVRHACGAPFCCCWLLGTCRDAPRDDGGVV